jgi:hypothetical protein
LKFFKKSLFVCQTNFLPFSLSFFLGPLVFLLLLCFVGRVLGEDLRCLVCLIYIIISFDYYYFFLFILLCVCDNDGCFLFFIILLASRRLSLSLFSLTDLKSHRSIIIQLKSMTRKILSNLLKQKKRKRKRERMQREIYFGKGEIKLFDCGY